VSTLYYIVRGPGGAPATSGGLQLDVSVGRLNLVMSESAVATAGEQMSNCALYYTAWLRAQIFRLRFQIFCKTRENNGCAGACTELHQVPSLNVMEWISNTMETDIQLHSTYTFSSYLAENEPEQLRPYIRLQTDPNVRFSAPYLVGTAVLSPE